MGAGWRLCSGYEVVIPKYNLEVNYRALLPPPILDITVLCLSKFCSLRRGKKNLVYVIMKVKMGELGGSKRIASSPSLRSRDELYGIEQRRA